MNQNGFQDSRGSGSAPPPPASAGRRWRRICKADDPVAQARHLVTSSAPSSSRWTTRSPHAPFLAALERHRVSLDSLRAFTGEQYNILRSDLRSNAHMVSRFGAEPYGSYFLDLTTSEAEARRLLLDFARALGMTERDLQAYEPRPGAQAYPSYAAWLAFYGSKSDIAAAYLLNFPVFGANTGRMAVALRERYGFSEKDNRLLRLLRLPAAELRGRRPERHPGRPQPRRERARHPPLGAPPPGL